MSKFSMQYTMDRFSINRDSYPNELKFLQIKNTFMIHVLMIISAAIAALVNLWAGRFEIAILEVLAILVLLPMLYLYPKRKYYYNAYILVCVFVTVIYSIAFFSKNDITILTLSPLVIIIGFLMHGNRLGILTTLLVFMMSMFFLQFTDFVSPFGKSADYLNLTISPLFTYIATWFFSSNLRNSLSKVTTLLDKNVQLSYQNSIAKMGGAVAHEINNPLSIISGLTGLIEKELKKETPNRETLLAKVEKISTTVYRISNVTKALLDISYNPHNRATDDLVAVDHLIETSIALCSEKIKSRGIKLHLNNQLSGSQIKCNWKDVSRVLLALLENSISAIKSDNEGWIKIHIYDSVHNTINIEITDSGQGNSEIIKTALRTPLFTSTNIGKGSGVGLNLASRVIRDHGGTLILKEDSSNTCLKISIPEAMFTTMAS